MSSDKDQFGYVLKSTSGLITLEISEIGGKSAQTVFEEHKSDLRVGDHVSIAQGNRDFVVATIANITGLKSDDDKPKWRFLIECQPIGTLDDRDNFSRGGALLPVPLEPAYILDKNIIDHIFTENPAYDFAMGTLSRNQSVEVRLDGNKFFGKHIAVVGSTGSGKSCTVAKLLQSVVGISEEATNTRFCNPNNSHIIIFDLHSEYEAAFSLDDKGSFSLNVLSADKLKLPYWLMNSEELESLFIESNEANSHNQVSQFKRAVVMNKQRHNPEIKDTVTYDTPVYFSIREVCKFIENINREVIGRRDDEGLPKRADGELIRDPNLYFDEIFQFVPSSTAKERKATNGPFFGEFNRFVSRLETRLADRRLDFLLSPTKEDNSEYKSADFLQFLRHYLGYVDRSNVTVIDLSGVPFEVLSITVSLISRVVFDFCFHYTKLRNANNSENDVPVMIVCEEAHNYVPQNENVAYRPSRKSIERIAKEGRKYGLSLMVVSQRPSEVSETIFAQCSNFVALRLTNVNDQNYVKRLLPDNFSSVTESLPSLGDGECIVIGDAIILPSAVQMRKPNPEPQSKSVESFTEWKEDWRDVLFPEVLKRWRSEGSG
ncbi:MAG: ATP-binding protein [Chloroflexota bacterium]|nr:ATP-binding protein [Chloroflexota bacterium]